jgi:thermostable 8-oxoguanine DNA glycosylase
MIVPSQITNFNRTERELQEFWLFCIMVAGKNSDQTAVKVNKMVEEMGDKNPFEFFKMIRDNPFFSLFLLKYRTGQYKRIAQAIKESVNLDLNNATLEELMNVHGVGPKTARFFILHSRADARVAVLDTHILKWLRVRGFANIPDATPSGKRYLELEEIFLNICDGWYSGKSIADVDLEIWNEMRKFA